jgi:hypothetical protein
VRARNSNTRKRIPRKQMARKRSLRWWGGEEGGLRFKWARQGACRYPLTLVQDIWGVKGNNDDFRGLQLSGKAIEVELSAVCHRHIRTLGPTTASPVLSMVRWTVCPVYITLRPVYITLDPVHVILSPVQVQSTSLLVQSTSLSVQSSTSLITPNRLVRTTYLCI